VARKIATKALRHKVSPTDPKEKIALSFLPCTLFYVLKVRTATILIEKEIIEQCRKGNLQDFRKLVEKSSPFAYSVAFRLIGDEAQADDIVQETMITIWKSIRRIKSAESFRIVVNTCYDEMRRKKSHPEFIADEKAWLKIAERVSENPGSDLENNEMAIMIAAFTDKLSPKQKAVFVLADLEEMSNEEISSVTGMSRLNVKANLHYARKSISEMIRKHL
jgi:RNA polymerase sigma-70 factor (ECF subfamily)